MFEKLEGIFRKHSYTIKTIGIVIGSVTCLAATGCLIADGYRNRRLLLGNVNEHDKTVYKKFQEEVAEVLKDFNPVYKDGFDVPFVTKEGALEFLEKRGDTYQIDILDDSCSAIWISKEQIVE